jgi:hypothetical protein
MSQSRKLLSSLNGLNIHRCCPGLILQEAVSPDVAQAEKAQHLPAERIISNDAESMHVPGAADCSLIACVDSPVSTATSERDLSSTQ